MEDRYLEKYGQVDGTWLKEQISNFWLEVEQGDYDCDDNHRHCKVGDEKDEADYEYIASQGCCDSYDTEFTAPSGNVYRYGFNYGH